MSTFLGIPLSIHEENILTSVIIDVADKTHAHLSDEAVLHKLIDVVNERDELKFQLREVKKELWAVKKELSSINQNKNTDVNAKDIESDVKSSGKYTIAPAEELRMLCIENNLFTCADNKQYERFFEMNENGADLRLLASYAFACSDDILYSDIYNIFEKMSKEYHSCAEKDAEDEIEK